MFVYLDLDENLILDEGIYIVVDDKVLEYLEGISYEDIYVRWIQVRPFNE